jgi:mono/diheme cytochrome c family protein
VKYHAAEVAQSVTSTANSVPPTTGSVQRGCARSWTKKKLHLAKPGLPASGSIKLGDAYRGQTVFFTTCAVCHGSTAQGGVGPKLTGAHISLARAKAQIDNGGGAMPPKLVQGGREEDVLAYLSTILAR